MGWINRLVNVFRKDGLGRQIDEELEFYLAARVRDNIASAMKPEEARRDAKRRFGNPALTLENTPRGSIRRLSCVKNRAIGVREQNVIVPLREAPGPGSKTRPR